MGNFNQTLKKAWGREGPELRGIRIEKKSFKSFRNLFVKILHHVWEHPHVGYI